MWKTIKKIIWGKTKNQEFILKTIETDHSLIAKKFNNYFIQSIEKITMKISGQDIMEIVGKIKHCNSSLKKIKPISFAKLNTIKKLKKKNSNVDGITTNILHKVFEVIDDQFLQLVNISLDYGTFPKH